MAQPTAPDAPLTDVPFVDPRTGVLSITGRAMLEQLWRQQVAGFVIVPVSITGTNILVMTPTMHREGARAYADHMAFAGQALNDSTGTVTAKVEGSEGTSPGTLKVYVDDGATQAGSGDIAAGSFYVFFYVEALDSGSGGFVMK